MLLGAGVLEDGVQRRDDRHPQVAQQPYDVAAGRTAEDAVLVLEADDIGVGEIEEIGRPQVGVDLLLLDFEPNFRRVVVPLRNVVDRHDETIRPGVLGGDRRAEVVGESRDAASSRQVIADECDLLDLAVPFHHGLWKPKCFVPPCRARGHIGRAVACTPAGEVSVSICPPLDPYSSLTGYFDHAFLARGGYISRL